MRLRAPAVKQEVPAKKLILNAEVAQPVPAITKLLREYGVWPPLQEVKDEPDFHVRSDPYIRFGVDDEDL